jgi:hypothetical protein
MPNLRTQWPRPISTDPGGLVGELNLYAITTLIWRRQPIHGRAFLGLARSLMTTGKPAVRSQAAVLLK